MIFRARRAKPCSVRGLLWFIFVAAALMVSQAAYAGVRLSEVVTFGDSLTNNEFLFLYYGNPKDMYGHDPMDAVFRKGSRSGNHLTSYAVASTESGHLELEIYGYFAALATGRQNKATLFGIETGGNDILNNLDLLGAYAPGQNASADDIVNDIIRNIRNGWSTLKASHPKAQFVFWTIPDVTLIPQAWNNHTSTEVANIRAHLKRVNRSILKLRTSPSVVVLDLYALIRSFVNTPPLIYGHPLLTPPVFGAYDSVFADEIHPTAVTNALIANTIIARINAKWSAAIPFYTESELAGLAHIEP